jgi:VCBS repeat-containing protein
MLDVFADGVLENDDDPEFDRLTAVLDQTTTNGQLILDSDGDFNYTPDFGFSGEDSFTYHANDGFDDSNIVTVRSTWVVVEAVEHRRLILTLIQSSGIAKSSRLQVYSKMTTIRTSIR